jgi:DNA-binding transcriptional MerR regulator
MHGKYVTIGEFAEMAELSASMLRHYDRLGLIHPAVVDPDTRYRYYREDQVRTAELIRLLRDLDVSLDDIAALLQDPARAEMKAILRRHRERTVERRNETERIIRRLDRALRGDAELMPNDIRLVRIKPQWVVSRRVQTPLSQDVETVDRLLDELKGLASACDALSGEREFVLYYNRLRRGRSYDLEACVPLDPRRAARVVGAKKLPGGRAAGLIHHGPWEDLHTTHVALYAWIMERGYEIAGPARETYVVDERDTDDPLEYVTRVDWPVKP